MNKILIFILILLSTTFSSVFATDIDSVTFVCEEWPNTTNKDGTGVYWEILKLVYEPIGIKVKTQIMLWKRAKWEVKLGRVDGLVGEYYKKDDPDHLYPKWHITIEYPIVAVYKKGRFKDWKSKGLKSLSESRAVWIRGYDFDSVVLKNINVKKQEVNDDIQAMRLIASGRHDVYLDYESHIRSVSKELKIDLDKDYEIRKVKTGSKLFVIFDKSEKAKKLIKIFDERMSSLAKSGEIEKIYTKWGVSPKKFGKERFSPLEAK